MSMALIRAGAAAMQGARRRTSGGPTYLLSYDDMVFTRASEAAAVDPRDGWGFYATGYGTAWETFPYDLDTSWTKGGTPTVVDGLADPFGGMNASSLEDDDSGAFESVTRDSLTNMRLGQGFEVDVYFKKDADTSRFPEVQLKDSSNGQTYYLDVNTSTGAVVERIDANWVHTDYTMESFDDDWWKLTASLVSAFAGRKLRIAVVPAIGTTHGVATTTAVGSTTVFIDEIRTESGWLDVDVPRITPDGLILIEGARTNLAPESADFSDAAWTKAGASVSQTETAPDGSPAWTLTDTSGGYQTATLTWTADATKAHTLSCYVLKDAVSSRVPSIGIEQTGTGLITGGAVRIDLRTDTGAFVVRSGTASVVIEDVGDWWFIRAVFTVGIVGTFGWRIAPASGTTLGSTDVAATGSVTVWGVQVEAGVFPSSPTRTAGAAATRAADVAQWPNAQLLTVMNGRTKWSVWPAFASSQTDGVSDQFRICGVQGTNQGWQLGSAAGSTRVRVITPGGTPQHDRVVSFSAGQRLDVTIDFTTGYLKIEGATTGNGEWTETPIAALTPSGATLRFGSGSSGNNLFYGLLSLPVAA